MMGWLVGWLWDWVLGLGFGWKVETKWSRVSGYQEGGVW